LGGPLFRSALECYRLAQDVVVDLDNLWNAQWCSDDPQVLTGEFRCGLHDGEKSGVKDFILGRMPQMLGEFAGKIGVEDMDVEVTLFEKRPEDAVMVE
jgi:hypothetical protein